MGRRKLLEDDELLARAREIFLREGLAISSRRLAEQIGVSDSVLFQRFGSKEELVFAAMTPPAPDMSALFAQASSGNTLSDLQRSGLGLLDYFRQLVPILAPLSTHPAFSFDAFRKRHPNSPLEKLTVELMTVWEEKRQNGSIDCPNVGPLVLHLLAVAYGLAMFEWLGVHESNFSEETVRELIELLWVGISPRAKKCD